MDARTLSSTNLGQSKKVKTSIRLNVNAWYYLVGTWTWDPIPMDGTINVYVFGLDGAGDPVLLEAASTGNTIGEPYQSDGALLIGSQILDASASAHGYYGFNGKINAVKVSAETKSEADLLAFYQANEALTGNW